MSFSEFGTYRLFTMPMIESILDFSLLLPPMMSALVRNLISKNSVSSNGRSSAKLYSSAWRRSINVILLISQLITISLSFMRICAASSPLCCMLRIGRNGGVNVHILGIVEKKSGMCLFAWRGYAELFWFAAPSEKNFSGIGMWYGSTNYSNFSIVFAPLSYPLCASMLYQYFPSDERTS